MCLLNQRSWLSPPSPSPDRPQQQQAVDGHKARANWEGPERDNRETN